MKFGTRNQRSTHVTVFPAVVKINNTDPARYLYTSPPWYAAAVWQIGRRSPGSSFTVENFQRFSFVCHRIGRQTHTQFFLPAARPTSLFSPSRSPFSFSCWIFWTDISHFRCTLAYSLYGVVIVYVGPIDWWLLLSVNIRRSTGKSNKSLLIKRKRCDCVLSQQLGKHSYLNIWRNQLLTYFMPYHILKLYLKFF